MVRGSRKVWMRCGAVQARHCQSIWQTHEIRKLPGLPGSTILRIHVVQVATIVIGNSSLDKNGIDAMDDNICISQQCSLPHVKACTGGDNTLSENK
mmetsp:Transcript_2280/g.5932  ORF Transcript_2280/g.5932 Transcript_2280/m.5932 type:complete len:96 (+) Transcript_2280:2045-2332(+)